MDTCTALTLVFPIGTHSKINEIRSKHDKAYGRWFPHINFLFPFVSVGEFDNIANRLSRLQTFGAFDLDMNTVGYFMQGSTATFHLKPSDDTKLQQLYKLIREILPEIPCKRNEFHPHLTLGQFPKYEINQRKNELEAWLGSGIKIHVNQIHLISRSRNDGTPFQIDNAIMLNTNNISGTTNTN